MPQVDANSAHLHDRRNHQCEVSSITLEFVVTSKRFLSPQFGNQFSAINRWLQQEHSMCAISSQWNVEGSLLEDLVTMELIRW